ncbi:hypothetical protein ACFVZW_36375, partial [Streptomyces sp. NPDC059567]
MLEARPESEDRTELLWAVGDVAGVERWIAGVLEAEPDAALPRLVAGIRHISWGWEARTGARAQHVSREQIEIFHDRLRTAEKYLYEVAEREPQWTSPWYGLQTTGRGLQVGPSVARRRFEATVRRDPHHPGGVLSIRPDLGAASGAWGLPRPAGAEGTDRKAEEGVNAVGA